MEKVCNACRKIEKELSQFLKNICGKRGQKGQNVKQKQNKKKETRHGKVFQAVLHAEEKVGIKTDPIRQKSGKVVKNCGFYEKTMGKDRNVVEIF